MSNTAPTPHITRAIFDNDGVNIDSEDVAMGDMDEFGYDLVHKYIDPETSGLKRGQIYIQYKGISSNKIMEGLIRDYNLPEDSIRADYDVPDGADLYEFLSDLHTKSVIKKFESGQLITLSGFKETITSLRDQLGGDNVALCTTSRADRMHATEHAIDPVTGENSGWAEAFPDKDNLRVSGYGHDNKYIYFRELHPEWDPEETAIIEDTKGSMEKARAAGFENIIGIVASKFQCLDDEGNFSSQKQQAEIASLLTAGAQIVVTDYRDIKTAIEWISQGMDMDSEIAQRFKSTIYHNQGQPSGSGLTATGPKLKQ